VKFNISCGNLNFLILQAALFNRKTSDLERRRDRNNALRSSFSEKNGSLLNQSRYSHFYKTLFKENTTRSYSQRAVCSPQLHVLFPGKCELCFANSLASEPNETSLKRFLTFQVPNHIPSFRRAKKSVQIRDPF